MTKKDFTKLAKQLTQHFPAFAVEGPMMFAIPVGHTLRGVYFEGSTFDSKSFYVWVFFLPLFVPVKHIHFTLGKRVCGRGERWNASDPDLIEELRLALQREAFPFLTRLHSLEDVVEAIRSMSTPENPHVKQALAYALARDGQIDRSVAVLHELVRSLDLKVPWQREMVEKAESLGIQLRENPSAAQRQLDDWELESARNLELTKFH